MIESSMVSILKRSGGMEGQSLCGLNLHCKERAHSVCSALE